MKKYLLVLLPIISIMTASCKKEKEPENPIEIGKFYQGGYIFYIDATGQHGMVMAGPEVERTLPWGCYGTPVNIFANPHGRMGYGKGNTYAIKQICSEPNSAANYCYDLLINGYDDWYLPTLDEMDSAFNKLGNISQVSLALNDKYWVSCEGRPESHYGIQFSKGPSGGSAATKANNFKVRPTRMF